jgi:hypothetical protein
VAQPWTCAGALSRQPSFKAAACAKGLHHPAVLILFWFCTPLQDALHGLQPTEHYEDVETKRRLNNIIHVSGLIDSLTALKARPATKAELCLVHTAAHVENIQVCAHLHVCC